MNNIEFFCTICFKDTLDYIDFNEPYRNVTNIQNTDNFNTNGKWISYLDCFYSCTNFNLACEADMVQVLCIECAKELEITYSFLRKAKQAEVMYNQSVSRKYRDDDDDDEETQEQSSKAVMSEAIKVMESNNDIEFENEELCVAISSQEAVLTSDKAANCAEVEALKEIKRSTTDLVNNLDESQDHQTETISTSLPGKAENVRQHKLTCNQCDKVFLKQSRYDSHQRYHSRKLANHQTESCPICYKQFITPQYLRQHMLVHSEERQLHPCEQCDKLYYSKTALENHMRLHAGNASECEFCGKLFSRRYELEVHMRFHKKDYPFACTLCDKKFTIKGHLRTHMWRHQGIKLQCDDCGKLFTSTKALNEHSYTHTTMPYKCVHCDRGYPSKQKYKVHMKSAHNIEFRKTEAQLGQSRSTPKPLQRRKLTLVQVNNTPREIEIVTEESNSEPRNQ